MYQVSFANNTTRKEQIFTGFLEGKLDPENWMIAVCCSITGAAVPFYLYLTCANLSPLKKRGNAPFRVTMFCRLAFTVTLFRASKVNNQFNTISLAERFNPIRKVTANSKHSKYGDLFFFLWKKTEALACRFSDTL